MARCAVSAAARRLCHTSAMRRAAPLCRHAARLGQPSAAEAASARSPVLFAEASARQDAGLHATAIGAPSASFVDSRAALGQLGFARSFASSAIQAPFRATAKSLEEDDSAAPAAAAVGDVDDEEETPDWAEDDNEDGSDALLELPEIESMSRKRQQFLLTQILRGRGTTRETSEEPDRTLDMHVVDVNRTVKVTKGGSLMRFTALVVVGNGDGVVGWGKGKAPEVGSAVDKAYWRAARSLFYFERFENHTIFHPSNAKFGKTKVEIAPLPSGYGLRTSRTIKAVCELAGIEDMRAKVHGSHNPQTTIRALFEALDAIRSPEEVAQFRGRTVIPVNSGQDFKRAMPYGRGIGSIAT